MLILILNLNGVIDLERFSNMFMYISFVKGFWKINQGCWGNKREVCRIWETGCEMPRRFKTCQGKDQKVR